MAEQLNHRLDGPEDAPVVVLSCSLGTDLATWEPQVGPLSERFRILRYDLRGHGRSPVPTGPYAMSDLGEDVLALMDELELERASLCGLSIGGMASMWAAAHAPERIERLILCCTSAQLGPPETWHERAATVRAGGVQEVVDAVLERWFTPEFGRERPETVQRVRDVLCATPREGYAGCCEAIASMDLRPDLPGIRAPTLVIAGEEDPSTPPEHGRAIADAIPSAEFTVLAGARHLAPVERAEEVTELISGFLDPILEEVA